MENSNREFENPTQQPLTIQDYDHEIQIQLMRIARALDRIDAKTTM